MLNADFSRRVVVDINQLGWQSSADGHSKRKRLDLMGAQDTGRVTSVVRYAADSSLPEHDHPGGEEILVLRGVLSDHRGHFAAGTYLLNPPGFRHAPFSEDGCMLFVKLRQYRGSLRERVVVDTRGEPWLPAQFRGLRFQYLYCSPCYPELVRLLYFEPGTELPRIDLPLGEELLVLEGTLEDERGVYPSGTWIRQPPGSAHAPRSREGCIVYAKSGGFPLN